MSSRRASTPSTFPDGAGCSPTPWSSLEERRGCAEKLNLAASVDIGPLKFSLAPHGWGKYRYCLDHPIGRIGATSSSFLPALRVQPRSEFIHAIGPTQAVVTFENLLRPLCSEFGFGVSRVDLYVDVQGFPLDADDRERYDLVRRTARRLGRGPS